MILHMLCSTPAPRGAKRRRNSEAAVAPVMTSDVKQQALRLRHLREVARRSQQPISISSRIRVMRPDQDSDALTDGEADDASTVQSVSDDSSNALSLDYHPNHVKDPLIYPGLYAPSGIDMLQILVQIARRPNPKIIIGALDSSCALLLCDVKQRDLPIIYCSEPFELLTGYRADEILGRNCRFLQAPSGQVVAGTRREFTDNKKVLEMKNSIVAREETQTVITNYKRDGTPFVNILTMIPLRWETNEVQYIVGFQVDRESCYLKV